MCAFADCQTAFNEPSVYYALILYSTAVIFHIFAVTLFTLSYSFQLASLHQQSLYLVYSVSRFLSQPPPTGRPAHISLCVTFPHGRTIALTMFSILASPLFSDTLSDPKGISLPEPNAPQTCQTVFTFFLLSVPLSVCLSGHFLGQRINRIRVAVVCSCKMISIWLIVGPQGRK